MKKIFFIAFIAFTIFSCSSDSSSSSTSDPWELMNFPSDFITTNGNAIFCITSDNIIHRSIDNGINWNSINTGITNIDISNLFSINGTIYLSTTKYGISGVTPSITKYYKSLDNGDTWAQTWTSLQNLGNGLPSKMYQLGSKLIGASNSSSPDIFSSIDNGITWSESPNTFISPVSHNFIYDENNFYFITGQSIYKSNNGVNFNILNNTPNVWNRAATFIGNKIYLSDATNHGIKMSNDGGSSWSTLNNGLEYLDTEYELVSFLHTKSEKIFAGCEGGGVYLLNSNASAWEKIGNPEDEVFVSGTVYNIQTTDNYVFAVTSNGVYRHGI